MGSLQASAGQLNCIRTT